MNAKLYVLVREDLRPGQQAVQALHAAVDYVMSRPEAQEWWGSNTVVVLGVKNRKTLLKYEKMARDLGVPHLTFREPDMWNQQTAMAFESESIYASEHEAAQWMTFMVSDLKLALSKKRWWKKR
jgi:hypothetical protein